MNWQAGDDPISFALLPILLLASFRKPCGGTYLCFPTLRFSLEPCRLHTSHLLHLLLLYVVEALRPNIQGGPVAWNSSASGRRTGYREVCYCEDVGDVRACLRKLEMEFGLRIGFGDGSLAIN